MITNIIYALQSLHQNIPGVQSAPLVIDDYPPQLRTAQLPIVLTIPAAAVWSIHTHQGNYDEVRNYRAMVYVDPVAQGKPFEYALSAVQLIETFGVVYLSHYKLMSGIYINIDTIQDTGIQVMTYAGTDYHGFEYTLSVRSYK